MKDRKNLAEAKALIPLLRSIANEVRERRLRLARHESLRQSFLTAPTGEGFVTALEDLDSAIRNENRGIEIALAELDGLGLNVQSTRPFIVHIPGRTPGGDVVFSWEETPSGTTFRESEEVADQTNSTELA